MQYYVAGTSRRWDSNEAKKIVVDIPELGLK
jgi:hypothetical protein